MVPCHTQAVSSAPEASVEPLHVLDLPTDRSGGSSCPIMYQIRSKQELRSLLSPQSISTVTARIYFINQEHSWSNLQVPETFLHEIMDGHCIFGDITSFLACFREKRKESEEAYCVPFVQRRSEDKHEYAYIFKYPELKASKVQLNPSQRWRIRQTVIYHQYRYETAQSFWILLSPVPNSVAQTQTSILLEQSHFATMSGELRHLIMDQTVISAYFNNWRPFLAYHESQVSPLTGMLHGARLNQSISVDFDTMTDVHYVRSLLLPIKPILESQLRNLAHLKLVAIQFTDMNGQRAGGGSALLQSHSQWMSSATESCLCLKQYAEYLTDRCSLTIDMLSKRLEFRDKNEMQVQSGHSLQLNKFAVDDAIAVRVITFITLVYLSCSVVGTIMDMPFFSVNAESGALEVAKSLWVYAVISILLTAVTLAYWRWTVVSERRKRLTWSYQSASYQV